MTSSGGLSRVRPSAALPAAPVIAVLRAGHVLPSGGVGLPEISGRTKAGALAVSLGGPLLGDAFKGGSKISLRQRAERALELALGSQVRR